jgi:hypothetical protein
VLLELLPSAVVADEVGFAALSGLSDVASLDVVDFSASIAFLRDADG